MRSDGWGVMVIARTRRGSCRHGAYRTWQVVRAMQPRESACTSFVLTGLDRDEPTRPTRPDDLRGCSEHPPPNQAGGPTGHWPGQRLLTGLLSRRPTSWLAPEPHTIEPERGRPPTWGANRGANPCGSASDRPERLRSPHPFPPGKRVTKKLGERLLTTPPPGGLSGALGVLRTRRHLARPCAVGASRRRRARCPRPR